MKYKTDCPCYSEVNMGNPGGVPHCSQYGLEPDCENCKRPKRTKADRIRSKTDEELAEWIISIEPAACPYATQGYNDDCNKTDCCQCWIDWLREVEE